MFNENLVKDLKKEYKKKKPDLMARLNEFKIVPESEYFYELVYCLFTPQTKAEHSFKVVEQMKSMKYFEKPFPLIKLLHQPNGTYIRFHNQKEKYVKGALTNFPLILSILQKSNPAFEKREWLIKNVLGLNYKEATHFLRNIGMNGNLAILDRHILKNLQKYGIQDTFPKTITKQNYLSIEKKFQSFCKKIKIDINEIDLLFWSIETGIILK